MKNMNSLNPNWFLRARLKTRQLLLLIALDEHRNIHRASNVLFMTQPAASKQLKDLEDMLEVRLFERLPHGMEPTIYGETMIRHARLALTNLSLAHDDIVALKSGLVGQVEVGVIMAPGMSLLPKAIANIKKDAPLLRIGVTVEQSNILLRDLQLGTLDFMIGRILEKENANNLLYEELTEEPVCIVARVGHPLLTEKNLQLKDIVSYPWILPPNGSILRHRFDIMFLRAGLETPNNVVDTTSLLLVTSLLQQTDSLHVIPMEVAQYYTSVNALAVVPIELPCKMDAFGIIMLKDSILSPSANLLLDEVRRQAREMYK